MCQRTWSKHRQKSVYWFVFALLFFSGAMGVMALFHMSIGAKHIAWQTTFDAIFNFDKTQFTHHIVIKQRLPRLFVAVACGAMLGLTGFQAQKLFQNPLVSATTLGVTSGAVFFVVAGIYLFNLDENNVFLPSFFGAISAGLLTFSMTKIMTKSNISKGVHIVLAGSLVSMLFGSLTIFIMSLDPLRFYQLKSWLLGDIAPVNFKALQVVWWLAIGGMVMLLSQSRSLDALMLGDKQAITLGVDVKRTRFLTLLGIFITSAVAVSVVGPIGFVGLVVPHIVKMFVNETGFKGAFFSMLLGAFLLGVADISARYLFAPKVVVVGAITASIGGVFFLGLLFIRARKYG